VAESLIAAEQCTVRIRMLNDALGRDPFNGPFGTVVISAGAKAALEGSTKVAPNAPDQHMRFLRPP